MRRFAWLAPVLIVLAVLWVAGLVAPLWLTPIVAARLHARLADHGLTAHWTHLRLSPPASLGIDGLELVRADGDTFLTARSLELRARLGSLLLLHPRIAEVHLDGLTVRLRGEREEADADSLSSDLDTAPAVAERVRSAATQFAKALLAPARDLPALRVTDARFVRGDSLLAAIDGLNLTRSEQAVDLDLAGTLALEPPVPFDAQLHWAHDDALTGRAQFQVPDPDRAEPAPLVLTIRGRVAQDRARGVLTIGDDTRVTVGTLALRVRGAADTHGPRFTLALALDSLTAERVQGSLPRPVLGPLADMSVLGSFDWRATFDADLAHPDSVTFHADVIPHALALDPMHSGLKLGALAGPFVATIHLPRDRIAHRDLSPANAHFRPLAEISPLLRAALVTNEDGGFFAHRGFNTDAIRLAIAADLRAGAYKRGAGTITMQLVRNLYLGHQRTLARKAQEVTLAWMLEHLTGIPKDRLLEIYLNIIEWGPEVHGADEAAHWYFGKDAAALDLDEALFLTILVPSPSKWRWRLTADGALRPYARAQMHFIAGKMAGKGWLDPAAVPPADSLRIELRGPAAALLHGAAAPAADTAAVAIPS